MSKILVTGIAGLLGSHVAEWLSKKGHKVLGVDNFSGGYVENIPSECEYVVFDLRNENKVDQLMSAHKFDYIYHFAAYAAVGLSPFIRKFNYENNIISSINLINSSIRYNVKKFIFASSMDVYGAQQLPFTEDMKPNPLDPYGIAKYAIEMDLANAYKQFGLKYTIVRPHNIIGPRQNIWDKYRNVAGIWIRRAMEGKPLLIYGDGEQRRAFSDVEYYMKPFEQLMTNMATDQEIINLGADKDYSINELAKIVQDIAYIKQGRISDIIYCEPRDEVKYAWCDHIKAKTILGFEDQTNLYSLIMKTWKWAENIEPKPVKLMDMEIEKGLYSYWKQEDKNTNN